MRRLLVLSVVTLLAATSLGCNSCGGRRTSWFGWFNRGDSCRTCGSGEVISEDYSGTLGTPILNSVPNAPRSSGILPGPIGVTPVPVDGQ
jgi:hypothetical protein